MEPDTPLKLPYPESLPGTDATLEESIRFARASDPTQHFRDKWGTEYASHVRALWGRSVEAYLAGAKPPGGADESLMCLAYDIVLGPYLGVPEPHKLLFLRWLIEAMRTDLRAEGDRSAKR